MKTTFIYALCEPRTRTVRYIGKTGNLKKRLRNHLCSKEKTHLGYWIRGVVARGEKPEMIVLRKVEGDGSDTEIRYIRVSRRLGIRLVNSTDGGDGVTMTPEIRRKIGDKNRGKPNVMKGRVRPPEFGASISATKMGHEVLLETRRKISETKKSRKLKHPPEWCAAQSLRMSGKNHPLFGKHHSEKTRELQSAAKLGKPATESQLANLLLGRKGPLTPEHRAAISESRRAGIARRKERDQEIEWALAPYTLTD